MVERKCPVCGTTYPANPSRLKHGRQTTCSRRCSYIRRGDKLTTSETKPCAVCGIPVTRPPSVQAHSKTDAFLCSPKCHYAARGEGIVRRTVSRPYNIPKDTRERMRKRIREQNARRAAEGRYGHTEETKRKLSKATAKAIAEGRIPRVSKLELTVKKELENLGVSFIHQKVFRDNRGRFGALPDFYLPTLGVALEVNGTFWHADPRSYPNGPQHPSQQRTHKKYEKKAAFMEARGIPIVELWEADLREDLSGAVQRAVRIAEGLGHSSSP